MRRFAVAALAVGLPLLSVATAQADTNTVTITGVAWKDVNGDGVRQPDEPLLPGIKVGHTTTDATGHYTLHDQSADPSVQASQFSIDDGRFVLTRPHQGGTATDSDYDWVNGWLELRQTPVDGVIDNIDVGYMPTRSDAAVKVTPSQPDPVHVGDDVTYQLDITNNAFPSYVTVEVAFPDGVTLDPYQGPSSGATQVGPTTLDIDFLRNQEPNAPRTRTVSAKVTKPIDGRVTAKLLTAQADIDPGNNEASAPLVAVAPTTTTTQPAPTTTAKPTAKPQPVTQTAQLANTGVDPVWPLGAGLVLLAAGVGTVVLARRRRA
ncbi:LPXTG cell wall anchor domain-containing protein [Kutzneria kofuensis]|uniref:LPXTG-motif cell wall-anchored protein n=1 Tax=Kutzneria kofuensis TaxID=103725 RepID=A0A7W9NHJ5_9PSEU|nr:LPXTG cell wall anchor domain-containing protein [Kutzneria kofuensis]MBB5892820.1 LPXTG-motif cell wall-anchored protein [Kutzneria kofuensis]